MSNLTDEQRDNERKVHAYNRMMERVKAAFGGGPEGEAPLSLRNAIDAAKDKAVELGELSREEAERIGDYLRRDLEDAGEFLAGHQASEFSEWLHFDLELIEDRLAELFLSVADQTTVELELLAERAAHADEYHTGEVIAMGTLECVQCGKRMNFTKTAHIPPCPSCHGTTFRRVRAVEKKDAPGGDDRGPSA